jgi:hypothetical protein
MTSNPPPEVQHAARVLQDWLDQQQRARLSQDAPRRLTDAERLDRCRQFDQTKMPDWQDPRKG